MIEYMAFNVYKKKLERVNEWREQVISDANGLIESYKWQAANDPYFEIDDDTETIINHEPVIDYDDATTIIVLASQGYATAESDVVMTYEDELENVKELESDLDNVIKVVQSLEREFEPIKFDTSNKSISTYLTFQRCDFEAFRESFEGALDFDSFIMTDDATSFTVRISDHEPGSYYDEAADRTRYYRSNFVEADPNNF